MSLLREAPRQTATALPTPALTRVGIVAHGKRVAGLHVTIGNCTPEQLDGQNIAVALFRANGSVALTMQVTLDSSNTVLDDDVVTAFVPVGHDVDTHDVTTWWAVVTSALGTQSVGATGEISAI